VSQGRETTMDAIAIRRVSVWLDSLAPSQGAFAHALDWAGHLELPLRIFAAGRRNHQIADKTESAAGDSGEDPGDFSPTIRACAETCDYSRVLLDPASWCGPLDVGLQEFLNPEELCVFGGALLPHEMDTLLSDCSRRAATTALVCSQSWQPVTRVLVLNQRRDAGNRFLDMVVDLCRKFQARPVILTVARSDAEAKLRQEFAEQALLANGLAADYDCVVGCRVRSAVLWAANWRRCSHLFVEKNYAPPWLRWLRGETVERLFGLSDTLTLLALPGSVALVGTSRGTSRVTPTARRYPKCQVPGPQSRGEKIATAADSSPEHPASPEDCFLLRRSY
jgi:hypothetical protein